jgi:hypothetical protein
MIIRKSKSIPVEYIQQYFEYREEYVDGVLQGNVYWKHREDKSNQWNAKHAGKKVNKKGGKYCKTSITYNKISFAISLHTIVWIINNNCHPKIMIDHKDRNAANNLISNLREADSYLNSLNKAPNNNRTSQYKGLSFKKSAKKWEVQISFNYKDKYIGYFVDELEAALAYNEAILKVHDTEFAYMNDISNGYTNKAYPNMPRHWVPEELAA